MWAHSQGRDPRVTVQLRANELTVEDGMRNETVTVAIRTQWPH